MPEFSPSGYQKRIFEFVQQGIGHGVVEASPGSGKTTTLVEIANRLPSDCEALFLALKKHMEVIYQGSQSS